MRMVGFLLATLAITNVVAQDSFCTKYAKALFQKNDTTLTAADELNLISAVVGRVVVGCDNTPANQFGVPGFDPTQGTSPFRWYGKVNCTWPNAAYSGTKVAGLVADANNAPFFLGTAPNYQSVTNLQSLNDAAGLPLNATAGFPSIRFVGVSGHDVTPNLATTGNTTSGTQGLIQHLVSYFGQASVLGCKLGGIPTYAGIADMKAVHAKMNITQTVWSEFVTSFVNTLLSFGVTQTDIDGTIKPFIRAFLLGGAQQICNDPWSCACAPINGQAYNNVGGTCVLNGTTTTTPPTNPPGNGTTSPPTKAAAPIVGTSVATMVAMIAALLLAFL